MRRTSLEMFLRASLLLAIAGGLQGQGAKHKPAAPVEKNRVEADLAGRHEDPRSGAAAGTVHSAGSGQPPCQRVGRMQPAHGCIRAGGGSSEVHPDGDDPNGMYPRQRDRGRICEGAGSGHDVEDFGREAVADERRSARGGEVLGCYAGELNELLRRSVRARTRTRMAPQTTPKLQSMRRQ